MRSEKKIHDTACGRIVAYGMTSSAASDVAATTAAVRSPNRCSAKTRIAMAMPGMSANTKTAPM